MLTSQERLVMGLAPDAAVQTDCLHQRWGSQVFRIRDGSERSWVLKRFSDPQTAVEVQAYRLLISCGAVTLHVQGLLDDAIVLEDLAVSPSWRLAREQDMSEEQTGQAIAGWYRQFHEAGRRLLEGGQEPPSFLRRESDVLTPQSIISIGEQLAVGGSVWQLAAQALPILKEAEFRLPTSLNYNDFHWSNLAISREQPSRAIVFDYHLMGIGPTFNDRRNVRGSLGEKAKAAFDETYVNDPTDELASVLDAPLGTLSALSSGVTMSRRPRWLHALVDQVSQGILERSLNRAVAACT